MNEIPGVARRYTQAHRPIVLGSFKDVENYLHRQQLTLDELWDRIASAINDRHGIGALADRPAPGIPARFYFATDTMELYQDNGTAWVAISGGGGITQAYQIAQDEGVSLPQQSVIDFVGSGVTATDGGTKTIVTIPGTASAYDTVQEEGVPLTQRTKLDFVGTGVTATDDAPGTRTVVTIPGETSAYRTIEDEGVPLAQQAILDFQGAGVVATNDGPGFKTVVTIAGSSGGVEIHATEIDCGPLPVNEFTATVTDADVTIDSNILAQILAVDPSTRPLVNWTNWVDLLIDWTTIPALYSMWTDVPLGSARPVDELIYDRATVAAEPLAGQVRFTLQALEGYVVDNYLVGYTVTA